MKKRHPVKNLEEMNFLLTEKISQWESGEIDSSDLKAIASAAGVVVKNCMALHIRDQALGVKRQIAMLDNDRKAIANGVVNKSVNLIDEFVK